MHHYCQINNPATWDEGYRDLIRQTYEDKEFFLTKWKNLSYSENDIP